MRPLFVLLFLSTSGCVAIPQQSIDREKIRLAILAHRKPIKKCYDSALKNNPDLAGRVEVEFDIDTGGKVTKAFAYENTTKDAELGICIADKVKEITFPEPPDAEIARVRYPFVFATSERTKE